MATSNKQVKEKTSLRVEELRRLSRHISVLIDYDNSQIRRYEEELVALDEDIEKLRKRLNFLQQQSESVPLDLSLEKIKKDVEGKMDDAGKFYGKLAEKSDEIENFEELFDLYAEFLMQGSTFNEYYDSYMHVTKKAEEEDDPERKQNLLNDREIYQKEIRNTHSKLVVDYEEFINFPPIWSLYQEHAEDEVETLLKDEEEKENGKVKEPVPLANSRENIDRAKMFIYIQDYLDASRKGENIVAPNFTRLKEYYDPETGEIPSSKFPDFFKSLTGIDISIYDVENERKEALLRQKLMKRGIRELNMKERDQLKKELGEKPEEGQIVEEKSVLDYISLREEEEEEGLDTKGKLRRKVKKATSKIDRITDPYLGDDMTQRRAEEVHDSLTKIKSGRILDGVIDLTRLPQKENLRVDFTGIVKDHLSDHIQVYYGDVKKKAKESIDKTIDKTRIGRAAKTKHYQVKTFINDKSTLLKGKRRKAREKGESLIKFLVKHLLKQGLEKAFQVTRTVYKLAKNTQIAGKIGGWFSSSSVGQKLQAAGTSTLKLVKAIAKMPGELKDGLLMRYDKVYKVIDGKILTPVIKPLIKLGLDVGYVGKTVLRKAPFGLVYGGGSAALALALGVPGGSLMPFFLGGGAVGVGMEVVDSIMNTPTTRALSRPLFWLQKQGSALYRDPITKAFSNEIIKNNADIAKQLSINGNAFGSKLGNIFSSIKTGMSAAMVAALVASVFGINPFVAAGVTFATVSSAKFLLRTVRGQSFAGKLLQGNYGKALSRFAKLPFNRILFQIQNTSIVSNLVQDLIDNFKANPRTAIRNFKRDNFSFADNPGLLSKLQILNNYIGLLGYSSGLSFLNRLFFGNLLAKMLPAGLEQFAGMGLREVLRNATGMGLFQKLLLGVRVAALPGIISAAGSITGLALAAALGIPISGLFATIGATIGGVIGFGVGALIAGSSFGTLLPVVFITSGIGTFIGTWIGSLFDKVAEDTLGGLFNIVSGIGALFTLIDLAYSGKSLRKMVMLSISLSFTMPGIMGIIEKSSQAQAEADPTTPVPTTAVTLNYQEGVQYIGRVKVINKSEEKISFERLNNMVKPLEKLSMERIYLVIDKNQTTASFINNNYLVITLSSERTSLEEELNGLITNINSSDNKVSQSQRNTK